VAAIDDSWRPEGRAPTEVEMEEIGKKIVEGSFR
jgi:hypothetical protein